MLVLSMLKFFETKGYFRKLYSKSERFKNTCGLVLFKTISMGSILYLPIDTNKL